MNPPFGTAPPPTTNTEPARKRGRPRKPPQQGPIIATTIRSQVTRTVMMGAYTERQLSSYIEWASRELHITKQHTMTVFMDRDRRPAEQGRRVEATPESRTQR